ncbi:MAG: hypothetical protein J0L70_06835 [Leptolyngbya sp. UWPOB_LEPTO1]|uniref:hypothetical protein n=1 Tax=Leptolyngbya sp. UWPOB_LEPTO1 TaxID=2815653 RepID=UPI001ACC46D0|nr:hypothetical protein [Leptolyngbya sp. UWPOB_LEPTO1]MBN8560218.1 hypothetical protein [Leptolyngbya sp. UWPOB_LEPTO1]
MRSIADLEIFIGFSFEVASLGLVQLLQQISDSFTLSNEPFNMYDWQLSPQRSLNASTDLNRCNAKAKLITFKPISLHEPAFLLIEVQDFQGKAIKRFDQVREQQMRLIVVSDDLHTFESLYPNYQGNGRFTVEAIFFKPGSYTLFSCYQPSGQQKVISSLKLTVPGFISSPPAVRLGATQVINNTKIQLCLPQPITQFGEEMTIVFDLQDPTIHSNRRSKLNRGWGNLVIVKRSSNLNGVAYIPAQLSPGATVYQLKFATRLLQPGLYKLWLEFERGQEILLADFWLNLDAPKSCYH